MILLGGLTRAEKKLLIASLAIFILTLSVSTVCFNFIPRSATGFILILNALGAIFTVLVFAFTAGIILAKEKNKLTSKNDDEFVGTSFYIKKFTFFTTMIILRYIAVSFAGGLLFSPFFIAIRDSLDSSFISGMILKLPILILLLFFVFKLFYKYGFLDMSKREYNPFNAYISSLCPIIILTPGAIFSGFFDTLLVDISAYNPFAALSMNNGRYVDKYDYVGIAPEYTDTLNQNFNLPWVVIGTAITLIAAVAVSVYAYKRGRERFISDHPNTYV